MPVPISFTLPAKHATGPIRICAWTNLLNDQDRSNDTICGIFYLYKPKRDVGISAITDPPANSSLSPGSKVNFTVNVKDYGDSGIVSQQVFPGRVIINKSDTVIINGGISANLPIKSAETQAVTIKNIPLPSKLPSSFQICIETHWGIDINNSNDASCNTYKATAAGIQQISQSIAVSVSPNPFTNHTVIAYNLRSPGYARLKIYDITGRQVTSLADGLQTSGKHEVTFNSNNLKSGTYIYQLTTNDGIKSGKIELK